MIIRRGDVWLAIPEGAVGRDLRHLRAFAVVSPPELIDGLRTVIGAPVVAAGVQAPFRLAFRFNGAGALLVLDQVRAIDKSKLVRRAGRLTPATLKHALVALQQTFTP